MSGKVEIIVGSKSDLPHVKNSTLPRYLREHKIPFNGAQAISAHRNPDELKEYIEETYQDTAVYVCGAGWSAALPGAVKSHLLRKSLATVVGIALPSDEYPDAKDAEISITRLPPGIEVDFGGIGTPGFSNIAKDVVSKAESYDPTPDPVEMEKVIAKIKPPEYNIDL